MAENKRSESTSTQPTKSVSPAKSIPIEITRKFDAPVETVWRAWTNPEMAKQWWGPATYTCPEAKLDARVAGKYLLAMQDAQGQVFWSGGEYRVVDEYRRLEMTDRFTDARGEPQDPNDLGMPGEWPDTLFITVDFESEGKDGTAMRLKHVGIPAEMHDECVDGWGSSLDKLQKLVERS